MSSPTIQKGFTWGDGATVMPTRLNQSVDDAEMITTQTNVVIGRSGLGGGPVEELPCYALGRSLLAAAAQADAQTALGLGSIATQAASNVNLSGGKVALDNYAANPDSISYGSTVTLSLASSVKSVQTLTLAGNVTFATSNLASGRVKWVRIVADGSARSLAFPAGWVFINSTAPSSIAAGKTAVLVLWAFGTADTDVIASYGVQP